MRFQITITISYFSTSSSFSSSAATVMERLLDWYPGRSIASAHTSLAAIIIITLRLVSENRLLILKNQIEVTLKTKTERLSII